MDDRRGDGGAPAGEDGGLQGAVVVLLMLEGIAALFFFGVLSVDLVRDVFGNEERFRAAYGALLKLVLLGDALVIAALFIGGMRAVARFGPSVVLGVVHNVVGALGLAPLFIAIVVVAALSDNPLFVGKVPDVGILLFIGTMIFSFPVLGVYLVRRGGTNRALLGHSIGALLLVPGWLALGAMWLIVTGELSA